MLTLRQSPFDLFERLEQQIATAERVPNAEIVETDNGYVVRLELPGVQRDTIDIKATDRNLVISAERAAMAMRQLSDERVPQRHPSRSSASYSLNWEDLTANFRDGILEITAGKLWSTQRRRGDR